MYFQYTKIITHMNVEYVNYLISEYDINQRCPIQVYIQDSTENIITAEFLAYKIKAIEIDNKEYLLLTNEEYLTFQIPFEEISVFEFEDDGYITLYVGDSFELPEPKDMEEE